MNRLLVFARAPRLGQVKRRLAAAVGAEEALEFYRASLFGLIERTGFDPRWHTCLAVTPDAALCEDELWPVGIERRPQGEGGLGERMRRALQSAPPGPVALIGSDIPGIEAAHLVRAFEALATHDFVFGPADDGGFWLIGTARRRPLPHALFRAARLSSEHALADCLTALSGQSVALIDRLADIDDGPDFERWCKLAAVP